MGWDVLFWSSCFLLDLLNDGQPISSWACTGSDMHRGIVVHFRAAISIPIALCYTTD